MLFRSDVSAPAKGPCSRVHFGVTPSWYDMCDPAKAPYLFKGIGGGEFVTCLLRQKDQDSTHEVFPMASLPLDSDDSDVEVSDPEVSDPEDDDELQLDEELCRRLAFLLSLLGPEILILTLSPALGWLGYVRKSSLLFPHGVGDLTSLARPLAFSLNGGRQIGRAHV